MGGEGTGWRKWQHWARLVVAAYPKGQVGPRGAAMDAACRFIDKISQNSPSTVEEVTENAIKITKKFAAAVEGAGYIPHLRTWVDDGWWEMDEEEWRAHGRNPKDLVKQNAQKRASVASSRAADDRAAQRLSDDAERQAASEAAERAKAAYRAMTPDERDDAVGRVREKYPMMPIPDPLPDEPTALLARAVARAADDAGGATMG